MQMSERSSRSRAGKKIMLIIYLIHQLLHIDKSVWQKKTWLGLCLPVKNIWESAFIQYHLESSLSLLHFSNYIYFFLSFLFIADDILYMYFDLSFSKKILMGKKKTMMKAKIRGWGCGIGWRE